MQLFWRKANKIEALIGAYFETCDRCFELFEKGFDVYLDEGLSANFETAVYACHAAESAADDKRREVEQTLYAKALLPDSRGDLLSLLEVFDKIPNRAETILFTLLCQKITLPDNLAADFKELVALNMSSYSLIRKAVDALFSEPKQTHVLSEQVDEAESASDRKERELLQKLFTGDYSLETRIMLKEVCSLIGDIADRAETCADRVTIIAIKRQI
jgi:predicted phosphate transport protein (TIGR00153 family)